MDIGCLSSLPSLERCGVGTPLLPPQDVCLWEEGTFFLGGTNLIVFFSTLSLGENKSEVKPERCELETAPALRRQPTQRMQDGRQEQSKVETRMEGDSHKCLELNSDDLN